MGHRISQNGEEVYATRSVDFSHDGTNLLVARHSVNHAERLELLTLSPPRVVEQWGERMERAPTRARFAPGDRRLFMTDTQRRLWVFDRDLGSHELLRANIEVFAMARQAPRVAVVGATVEVLDTRDGQLLWDVGATFPGLKTEAVALSADGTHLALTGWGGRYLALLHVDSQSLVREVSPWDTPGTQLLGLGPLGQYITLTGSGGSAAWSTDTGARVTTAYLSDERNAYTCQAFHPELPVLLMGTRAGYVMAVHLETSDWIYGERVHSGRLWDVTFSPDGSRVASAGDEGDVYLQDWAEMKAAGRSRIS